VDWYRRYNGTTTDAKLRLVAKKTSQHLCFVIAVWDHLLEFANSQENDDRGSIAGFDLEVAAAALDLEADQVGAIVDAMCNRLHDGERLIAFARRNYLHDDDLSTARVRRHRAKIKQTEATPPTATPPIDPPKTVADETVMKRDETFRNAPEGEGKESEKQKFDRSDPLLRAREAPLAGEKNKNNSGSDPPARVARPLAQGSMLLPLAGTGPPAPVTALGGKEGSAKAKRERWIATLGDFVRDVEPDRLGEFWAEAMKPPEAARPYLNLVEKRMHASVWWRERTQAVNGGRRHAIS
jgi:hypothetical protein